MMASSAALRSSFVIKAPEVEELNEVEEIKDANERGFRARYLFPLLLLLPQFPLPRLLVFFIDLADCAVFVKHGIEHFMLAEDDFAELFLLNHGDSLHLDHFQQSEKSDDHGMTRRACLKKSD